jgi:outer membrane protein OmpA-like peptidoglycan-associated protein
MKVLDSLTEKEKSELKVGVIEVTGKAMNRTALGVVDALMQLYPKATFDELKQMLPDTINTAAPKNYKSLFKPYTERLYGVIQPGSIKTECQEQGLDVSASHFIKPEETFKTIDGVEVLVAKSWESADTSTGENDLQNLINHVSQFGVKVTKVEKKESFNKGEYNLEIINPVLFKQLTNPEEKKKFPWWILILIALLLAILAYFLLAKKPTPEVIPAPQAAVTHPTIAPVVAKNPEVQPEVDTITSIKNAIAAGANTENRSINFNDILFKYDSDSILTESNASLNEAYSFLNEIPKLKVKIVGHTSNEGKAKYNQKLSKKRAVAVLNYLVGKGITEDRMFAEGKGSSEAVAENDTEENKQKNRRIQFIITDDGNN